MNRIQYMTELASLLQNIPDDERKDAMKYYNDYFDEAGEENEEAVIEELGSPRDVAAQIKADLSEKTDEKQTQAGEDQRYYYEQADQAAYSQKSQMDPTTKKILIIVAVIVTLPITLSILGSVLGAILSVILTVFSVFIALVAAAIAIAIAGVALLVTGIGLMASEAAVGCLLAGVGLILSVLGAAASVGSVKLCKIAFPAIVRGCRFLYDKCLELWHRRAVA